MKNLILSATRSMIPYIKELKPLAGTTNACILMQQLDYWFARIPDGFYKFLEPCDNIKYKLGQSWSEELGFSVDEFRYAFDRIGIRYTSKTAYEQSEDKFQGKFYCSYQNKIEGVTYYFRNHAVTDAAIADALNCSPELLIKGETVPEKANSRRWGNSISVDGETQSPCLGNSISNKTEIKAETKAETTCAIGQGLSRADERQEIIRAMNSVDLAPAGGDLARADSPKEGATIDKPLRALCQAFHEAMFGTPVRALNPAHYDKYEKAYRTLQAEGVTPEQVRQAVQIMAHGTKEQGAFSSPKLVTPNAVATHIQSYLAVPTMPAQTPRRYRELSDADMI